MHRRILRLKYGARRQGDHVNHDTLNNTRENLRLATRGQNPHKQRLSKVNTSGYKGVYWHKRDKTWIAHISAKDEIEYLGSYDLGVEAARSYDSAALKYFGEFAYLNFPPAKAA